MPMPIDGVQLIDKQEVTTLLLKSGADITEVNTVRKHLSAIKGRRLAENLYPATILTLIISDVVGDRLDSIASGPTVPDLTTYADAKALLEKYEIWNTLSDRTRFAFQKGLAGELSETPKANFKIFQNVHNVIVGSIFQSCLSAASTLKQAGYATMILSTRIQGESKHVGRLIGGILVNITENRLPLQPAVTTVAGGETTVTVSGRGTGGRNQEVAWPPSAQMAQTALPMQQAQ